MFFLSLFDLPVRLVTYFLENSKRKISLTSGLSASPDFVLGHALYDNIQNHRFSRSSLSRFEMATSVY